MSELPPIELCTDSAWYPYVGEQCDLVAHPFGKAKEKVRSKRTGGFILVSIKKLSGTLRR